MSSYNEGLNRAFWEGREFRLDFELSGTQVFEFISPVDFVLRSQTFISHDGTATFAAYAPSQGVASGVFSTPANVLPNNNTSVVTPYTRKVTMKTGGSFAESVTPNEAREYIKVVAASATAQRNTVGETIVNRGLPAGTYYLKTVCNSATYKLLFEELN